MYPDAKIVQMAITAASDTNKTELNTSSGACRQSMMNMK
jgi:hypothetical protein